jgi:hypothetical protein
VLPWTNEPHQNLAFRYCLSLLHLPSPSSRSSIFNTPLSIFPKFQQTPWPTTAFRSKSHHHPTSRNPYRSTHPPIPQSPHPLNSQSPCPFPYTSDSLSISPPVSSHPSESQGQLPFPRLSSTLRRLSTRTCQTTGFRLYSRPRADIYAHICTRKTMMRISTFLAHHRRKRRQRRLELQDTWGVWTRWTTSLLLFSLVFLSLLVS